MGIAAFIVIVAVITAVTTLLGVALAGDNVDFTALATADGTRGIIDSDSTVDEM